MNLTQFTDYSLRTLMYVATQPSDKLSTVPEIARLYHISSHHLTKAVHKLGKIGLLQTIRGRNGGFRLAKHPKDVNIGWVVRQTEDNWHIVECFHSDNNACILTPACQLKHILGEALEGYLRILDRYTLEDITRNRDELQHLFTS